MVAYTYVHLHFLCFRARRASSSSTVVGPAFLPL
jgi:hypothetical protein